MSLFTDLFFVVLHKTAELWKLLLIFFYLFACEKGTPVCVKFQVIISAVDTLIHSVIFVSAMYFWQKDNWAVECRWDFERKAFLSGWVQKAEQSPVLTLNKSSSQVETLFSLEDCLI